MKEIIIALLICVSSVGQTVPHDKFMHFSSCYIISATSTTILSYKYENNKAAWIGFGIGATIGISNHAQESLGDIVFIELPTVGKLVNAKDEICVVESV